MITRTIAPDGAYPGMIEMRAPNGKLIQINSASDGARAILAAHVADLAPDPVQPLSEETDRG